MKCRFQNIKRPLTIILKYLELSDVISRLIQNIENSDVISPEHPTH